MGNRLSLILCISHFYDYFVFVNVYTICRFHPLYPFLVFSDWLHWFGVWQSLQWLLHKLHLEHNNTMYLHCELHVEPAIWGELVPFSSLDWYRYNKLFNTSHSILKKQFLQLKRRKKHLLSIRIDLESKQKAPKVSLKAALVLIDVLIYSTVSLLRDQYWLCRKCTGYLYYVYVSCWKLGFRKPNLYQETGRSVVAQINIFSLLNRAMSTCTTACPTSTRTTDDMSSPETTASSMGI